MDPRERATAEALAEPASFSSYRKSAPLRARPMLRAFTVETSNGTLDGAAGDYLCIDEHGRIYPFARDAFESTFELEPVEVKS